MAGSSLRFDSRSKHEVEVVGEGLEVTVVSRGIFDCVSGVMKLIETSVVVSEDHFPCRQGKPECASYLFYHSCPQATRAISAHCNKDEVVAYFSTNLERP